MLNYFRPLIYVRLAPDCLTVHNPRTGETISEVPEVAITHVPKTQILAIGKNAHLHQGKPSVSIVNPFAHPRSMVSDFTVGELVLTDFVRRLSGKRLFAPAPKIVMHPLGEPEGGFTQVEQRAFQEMAVGTGARQVILWLGRTLSDDELIFGQFPDGGQRL